MAYTTCLALLLGAGNSGQSLEGQLVKWDPNTSQWVDEGSAITTGFTERGSSGCYLWQGSLPDGFRGGMEIRIPGSPPTVLAVAAVNPQEAEHADVKVSSRLGAGVTLTELGAGAPPATPTLEEALMFLYMALRNEMVTTATELTFSNAAGTVIARAALSDDGVEFTRAQLAAP
jgi:hypothetical protein